MRTIHISIPFLFFGGDFRISYWLLNYQIKGLNFDRTVLPNEKEKTLQEIVISQSIETKNDMSKKYVDLDLNISNYHMQREAMIAKRNYIDKISMLSSAEKVEANERFRDEAMIDRAQLVEHSEKINKEIQQEKISEVER